VGPPAGSKRAGGSGGVEGGKELFGGREIGIEAQDTEKGGAGVVELAGGAVEAGEVHANFAFSGGTFEGGLPKFAGFGEVSLIGFDGGEVGGGFQGVGIEHESFLVERSGFGKIATLLGGEGKSAEKRGIIRRIGKRSLEKSFGLRLSHGHAAVDDGLPGESEVARIFGRIGSIQKGNESGNRGGGWLRGGSGGRLGMSRDAVVGDLGVGDVGTLRHGHVAGSAVGLILVVFGGKLFAVARNAFDAEIGGAIFGRHGLVRIVAGGASESVAGLLLAATFGESFELAGGAESWRDIAGEDVVTDEGGEVVAGTEFVDVFAGALDGSVAFEMALHADLIAKSGRELAGIDDGGGAVQCVGGPGAVAAFASDAGEEERRVGIEIVTSREWGAHTAEVAMHATGGGGEVERHGGGRAIGGGHVPEMAIGVPVDGGFEEEAVGREKVSAAAAALADVVEEFPLTVNEGIARAVEGEDDLSVLGGNFVVNP